MRTSMAAQYQFANQGSGHKLCYMQYHPTITCLAVAANSKIRLHHRKDKRMALSDGML